MHQWGKNLQYVWSDRKRFYSLYRSLLLAAVSLLISMTVTLGVPLQHGKSLTPAVRESLDITQYFVSEKMDGVRGYWDGVSLMSRQGYAIIVPSWFIEHLGDKPLDGELWLGRGNFQAISALIARGDIADPLWQKVTYQVFDLPAENGSFKARVSLMQDYLFSIAQKNPHVRMIPQLRLVDLSALDQALSVVIEKGGEGLMLHHEDALYQPYIRHSHLLKVKHIDDGCARVVGYTQGKGKYTGKIGALIVEARIDNDIKRFNIGSGLTDAQRQDPPKIGDYISYLHNDYTRLGIPRFARLAKEVFTCHD